MIRLRIRLQPHNTTITTVDRLVELPLPSQGLRLGRRRSLEVELPFAAVSGVHTRIWPVGQDVFVEDLGSANGTFLDGQRLAPRVPALLSPGATFRLADVLICFEGLAHAHPITAQAGAPPAGLTGTAMLARRLVGDLFAAVGGSAVPRLVGLGGVAQGHELLLVRLDHPYRLGRSPSCDLVVDDADTSREHLQVLRRWDHVVVMDLVSKNGFLVNDQRFGSGSERTLEDGETLTLGSTAFRFEDPEARHLTGVRETPEVEDPEPKGAVPAAEPPQRGRPEELQKAPLPPQTRASHGGRRLGAVVGALFLAAAVALALWLFVGQ